MPKKTKQGKILAQLRRLQSTQVIGNETNSLTKKSISLNLETTVTDSKPTENVQTKIFSYDYSYVIKDLRKTLFFVVIAIVFQIVLSFIIKNWV